MAHAVDTHLALDTLPFWIGGKAVPAASARTGDITNPATGKVIRQAPMATRADVDTAVRAAQAAFPALARHAAAAARARAAAVLASCCERIATELAALVTEEHGKTLAEARAEVQRGIEVVEFAVRHPAPAQGRARCRTSGTGVDADTLRQPLGVCVGITPFNFPVMVPLWMFPVAIACGNTFVLKPSEKVPLVGDAAGASCSTEAGLPDGVFNVVHGDKRGRRRAAQSSRTSPRFRSSARRRSRNTSTRRARSNGKRVQALGGAKNHAVVLPDADLDFAANALIGAAYGSAGERCMAISAVVAVGAVGRSAGGDARGRSAAALKVGPGDAARRRHGAARHRRAPRQGRGLRRQRRARRARRSSLDGRG